MKLGIVGLPNVGKSTLFNAITNAGAQSANYPFCTIEPNVGMVAVPDSRLDALAKLYDPDKFTPAVIEFVDIAGLVRGASKGEGLGNKFLSHIREVDAVVHVVRCFEDGEIVHVDGEIGPRRDIETIGLELIFSDIDMPLLSAKPVIYAANMSEFDFTSGIKSNKFYNEVEEIAASEHAEVLPICAKIEEEITDMPPEDKLLFLEEMGLHESGLDRLIKKSYDLLGLISYLTAGKQEVRAWTITKGTKAPQAAGKIHSDFEKGFIRAEIVSFDELMACGSMAAAKEKGLVRSEGKDYVMQDGDVVLFRFNV